MGSCRHHGTFLLGAVFAGSKSTDSFDLASQCLAISVSAPVCAAACVWRSLQVYVEARHLGCQLSNIAHLVGLVFGFVFETGSLSDLKLTE